MNNLEGLQNLAEQWLHRVIESVRPTETALFVATFIVLQTIIMLLIDHFFGRKKPSTVVLLSGLGGSGKTVLFNRLRDVSTRQSDVMSVELDQQGNFLLRTEIPMLRDLSTRQSDVMSVELDQRTFLLRTEITMSGIPKPFQLVDVPTLERYLPRAAAVVFVVDSLEFLRNSQAASEVFYDILTNASVVTNWIPLLLCCNKTDKVTAHSKGFISRQMERELERLRSERNDFTLGIEGEVFSFSHCRNTIAVAETSGLTGETDQIQEFIREHVEPLRT